MAAKRKGLYSDCCFATLQKKINFLFVIFQFHLLMLVCIFVFADTPPGFVHSVSPMKKAKTGRDYYTFTFQTSPNKFTKAIGFDQKSHQQAIHFEKTKSPSKILSARDDDGQIFINQYASLIKANSSDIKFDPCKEPPSAGSASSSNLPETSATDITLQQLNKLSRNQKVNVKATLTMGSLDPKELSKRNGSKGRVKEDCVLEDKTGHAIIHLWDDTITALTSGQSYEIKNLSVKNFNGKTHLGTTIATTFTPIDAVMHELKGEELLSNIKKKITVNEFKFTDKVNTFMLCQIANCKKKMPYAVDCKVITCAACGTCQKVKAAERGMSARLCAEIDGKDVWLTAFTDVMNILIKKVNLSSDNTTDELKAGLLELENVNIVIDTTSNFILEVLD